MTKLTKLIFENWWILKFQLLMRCRYAIVEKIKVISLIYKYKKKIFLQLFFYKIKYSWKEGITPFMLPILTRRWIIYFRVFHIIILWIMQFITHNIIGRKLLSYNGDLINLALALDTFAKLNLVGHYLNCIQDLFWSSCSLLRVEGQGTVWHVDLLTNT